MGLLDNGKLRIRKETEGDFVHIFANYYRLRKKTGIRAKIIKDLAGKGSCLMVVDTAYTIKGNHTDLEKDIQNLIDLLDRESIRYEKIITTSNASINMLGLMIKLNEKRKEKNYIIGLVLASDELYKVESIIDKFNAFFYIDFSNPDPEELIEKLKSARGQMDELNNLFEYSIFNDNFTCQFRVNTKDDRADTAEEILGKYH